MGAILGISGVGLFVIAVLSMGVSVFAPMRTRDRLKTIFGAPFIGMIGAILAVIGYSMAGYGDLPAGGDTWVLRGMVSVFIIGVLFGIIARIKGSKDPAVIANEYSTMKRCPECAEQI